MSERAEQLPPHEPLARTDVPSPTDVTVLPARGISIPVPSRDHPSPFSEASTVDAQGVAESATFDRKVVEDAVAQVIENVTGSMMRSSLLRRTVIKAGLAACGLAAANTTVAYHAESIMHRKLGDRPAHFTWVTGYSPHVHDEVMLYFPGTGDIRSVQEARTFRRLSGLRHVPIGAFVMDHYHTDTNEVIERTAEALAPNPPQWLSSVGRSWGGPEGLRVTAEVAKLIGSKVGRFSMWSAPYDISDGYQGSLGQTLDEWAPNWNVVNFDGKVIAVIGRRIHEYGYWHTLMHVDEIIDEVMANEDWNGLRSDVHMLDTVDSHDTITRLLPQVMDPEVTSGSYISSFKPWTDPTVKVVPAWRKYNTDFTKVGIPFNRIPGDFEGHAKVEGCSEAMVPWLKKTNSLAT